MVSKVRFARVGDALGAHMDVEELLDAFAEGEGLIANTAFHGVALAYEAAESATFDTVLFRGCEFDGVDFSGCTFRDVRFEGCRFTRCSMERAWLSRCDILSCSAPGLNLLQARLSSVLFEETDLSYANLSETSIDRVAIRASRLREAAMQAVKAKRLVFSDSDLTRLDVFGTKLAGIDLSTCAFEAPVLSADYRELRGAVVSAEQALSLSTLLGFVIAEE